MSQEIQGVIRTLLAVGSGYLTGRGYIDSETASLLAGALATVAISVWSVVAKRRAGTPVVPTVVK